MCDVYTSLIRCVHVTRRAKKRLENALAGVEIGDVDPKPVTCGWHCGAATCEQCRQKNTKACAAKVKLMAAYEAHCSACASEEIEQRAAAKSSQGNDKAKEQPSGARVLMSCIMCPRRTFDELWEVARTQSTASQM